MGKNFCFFFQTKGPETICLKDRTFCSYVYESGYEEMLTEPLVVDPWERSNIMEFRYNVPNLSKVIEGEEIGCLFRNNKRFIPILAPVDGYIINLMGADTFSIYDSMESLYELRCNPLHFKGMSCIYPFNGMNIADVSWDETYWQNDAPPRLLCTTCLYHHRHFLNIYTSKSDGLIDFVYFRLIVLVQYEPRKIEPTFEIAIKQKLPENSSMYLLFDNNKIMELKLSSVKEKFKFYMFHSSAYLDDIDIMIHHKILGYGFAAQNLANPSIHWKKIGEGCVYPLSFGGRVFQDYIKACVNTFNHLFATNKCLPRKGRREDWT